MSNTASTQQIMQAVEYARSRALSAEQAFDRSNSAIQRQASRSIDIFGGSAYSTVANIARDARRACDDLYSAYQSLIVTLDETCRPLLSQDPDATAVRAVAELMKKLNDDSEIESNFTASLNGSSMGDVAGSRYVPSMNCKMIQRYWEDRYAAWPGRAEQEAAAREAEQARRREAEERANREYDAQMQRYEQQMELYRSQLQEYAKAEAAWKAEVEKVNQQRASELTSRLKAQKKEQLDGLFQTYDIRKKEAEKTRKALEADLEKANTDLAQAGVFAFGVKSHAKKMIKETTRLLDELKIAEYRMDRTYQDDKQKVEVQIKGAEAKLKAAIERQYPLPQAPVRPTEPRKPVKPRPNISTGGSAVPGFSAQSMVHEAMRQAIMDSMVYGQKYTITELFEVCPEIADMTNQRVAALMRQLVEAGKVIRTEDARKAYFELA